MTTESQEKPARWIAYGTKVVLLAGLYALAGRLGLALAHGHPGPTPVWPPSGISVAALLIFGYRVWPGVFLGAIAFESTMPCGIWTALTVSLGNTLESLFGAWLAIRFARGRRFYERPTDVLKFTFLVGMLSPLISPPLGLTGFSARSYFSWFGGGSGWLISWLGDLVSLLVLTPLLVIWGTKPRTGWSRYQMFEFALLMGLLIVVGEAVFGELAPASAQGYLLPYLCLPFLIWAAFRFEQRGATIAVLVLGVMAFWGTICGHGLFARSMPKAAQLAYQGFIAFNSALALAVAAVVAQRRHALGELQRARDELELRVIDRTAELEGEVTERKRQEQELRRLNRTLNALSHSNQVMMQAQNEEEYLAEVCKIITVDCGHAMVWIGFAEEDEGKTVRPVAHAGFEEGYLQTLKVTWADSERGRGPTGTAIRTGRPAGCRNMMEEPRFAPWREEAIRRGYASSIVVPLRTLGRAFGAVTIYARTPDAFSEHEIALLSELGDDLAKGITAIRLRTARAEAERALQRINEELERRVEQRTAALRAASLYARRLIEAGLDPLATISPDGKITDVNEATELVTGVARAHLIGSDFSTFFTEPESAQAAYQEVLAEGFVRDYPLTIRHACGRVTDVLYNATVYRDESGQVRGVFAAARDITERKAAEQRREVTHELLELFAHKGPGKEYFESVVEVIRGWTGCQCVGIRVADEDGAIPYSAAAGFDKAFLEVESRLSLRKHDCFCIRAISQQTDASDSSLMTPGGSMHCDDAPGFMSQLGPDARPRYRGTCVKWGFASLAVIPIRHRDRVLGVVHLADRRAGRFPASTVEFLESMTPVIGEAIQRFHAESEVARYRDHLEELVQQRTTQLEAANQHLLGGGNEPAARTGPTGDSSRRADSRFVEGQPSPASGDDPASADRGRAQGIAEAVGRGAGDGTRPHLARTSRPIGTRTDGS